MMELSRSYQWHPALVRPVCSRRKRVETPMQRYFFDINDGRNERDEEGV
jgi:hypothetical protein